MATRNSAAWLVLAAVLTIPSFMFFRWWTQLKSDQKQDMTRKVRNRLPGGQMFGQAPQQAKLNNPISVPASLAAEPVPQIPAAVAQPAAAAQVGAAGAAQPAVPGGGAADTPPAPGSVGTAATPAPAPAAALPTGYDPDSLLKTDPIAQIVLTRDPMLSPFDLVRIKEAEERTRLAREEIERASRPVEHKPVARRIPSLDSLIELQGIVSTDRGDKAIVNGEVVGEGDNVGEVKVLKITPTGVVFLYNKRRYMKGVSK